MSKSLVPRDPDPASGILNSVGHDATQAGIVIGTIVVHAMVPVFGWAVLLAGGGVFAYRAVKRGLKKR